MPTRTDWDVFYKLKLSPRQVRCQGYRPVHMPDLGCHTKLVLDADTFAAHLAHGGGFELQLRLGSSPDRIWKSMASAGLEITDLTCGVCQQTVPINVARIGQHLKAHLSANRQNVHGGQFFFTLGYEQAPTTEDQAWAEHEVAVDDAVREAEKPQAPVVRPKPAKPAPGA